KCSHHWTNRWKPVTWSRFLSKKKATTKNSAAAGPVKGKLGSSSPMDLGLLEQLVKLMSANDLNTVDVRDGDKRVILKRGAVQQSYSYTVAPAGVTSPAANAPNPSPT